MAGKRIDVTVLEHVRVNDGDELRSNVIEPFSELCGVRSLGRGFTVGFFGFLGGVIEKWIERRWG